MVSVKSRWGQGQWLGWWASCVPLSVTWALSSPVFLGWWVFQENIMGCPAWSSYLWLTTFLGSCGGSRQARRHFRINPPQRVLCPSPTSFTYPLQGANLQTLPGLLRVAQSSVAGRLGGRARLEGLNGSLCKLSNHAASGCTHFPHRQGHLIPSPFCILILPAFSYMSQSCFLAGSTTLSKTTAFSALQLPFVRLITSIQSAVTDISLSLWGMPSVCFLGRKQR